MLRAIFLLAATLSLGSGCATNPAPPQTGLSWPHYRLLAEQTTRLNSPQKDRFDASGLLITPAGEMLTMRNNHDSLLYRIEFLPGGAEARLVPLEGCFATARLKELDPSPHEFDCEGIAQDPQGRYYMCEERRRWILRCDPKTGQTERLPIDWSSVQDYFNKIDRNASFEGIAIGNGKLYVANERNDPVIIVVDLASWRVKRHFTVYPTKSSFFGTHYSDLCWAENKLWVLCRQHRVVLEVNPDTRKVIAEFDYGDLEESLGYRTNLPVGIMEGLAIDATSIWLVTDNNGLPRGRTGHDIRPTLVRCARPDLGHDSKANSKGK
ncbi:MAG TPA: esterase-like activity of phytase family protein [Verrucomicrobiae bacterium]|nr:esterase-like activity of phytase family protein [Verrucomicrobiae bacterium]